MQRRRILTGGGATVVAALAGCSAPGSPGTDGGSPDSATRSPTPGGVPVSVTDRADQPDAPIEYGVEMAASPATEDHPARIQVSITNTTDSAVALGEERDVQFHHVRSTNEKLYLHPAGDDARAGPVEPGCWRLTEPVAVPEYYGIIEVEAGETRRAESLVYGHPSLPEGECLPAGDHRVTTSGVVGDSTEAIEGEETQREFSWGFTLRIGGAVLTS